MSVNNNSDQNVLVDERLSELRELKDRRDELLREMFTMVRLAKRSRIQGANSSIILSEEIEEEDNEELEMFLDRFDLQKNPETGSIMALDLPDLYLDGVSEDDQKEDQLEEIETTEGGKEDEIRHGAEENGGIEDVAEEELEVQDAEADDDEDAQSEDAEASDDEMDVDEDKDDNANVEDRDGSVRAEINSFNPRDSIRSRTPGSQKETPSSLSNIEELSSNKAGDSQEDRDGEEQMDISFSSPPPTTRNVSSRHSSKDRASSEIRKETTPVREKDIVPATPSASSRQSTSTSLTPLTPISPNKQESRPRKPSIVVDLNDKTPLPPPRQPPPPIIVKLSVSQGIQPNFSFSAEQVQDQDTTITATKDSRSEMKTEPGTETTALNDTTESATIQPHLSFYRTEVPYYLPPLSSLPSEFNRKGKPQKRKKDREREKSTSDSGKKDDWVPLGLVKWQALLNVNPVHKRLSKATKCVLTRDWVVATTELKLMCAFDHIENLKRENKWSFRQYKKSRVSAGLIKTHWDYLMDEMKWLQVDFREERRWKIALAYELAKSVCEWHAAGSPEERIRLGICERWRRPDPLPPRIENDMESMDIDIDMETHLLQQNIDESMNEDVPDLQCLPSDEEDDAEDRRTVDKALTHNENLVMDEGLYGSTISAMTSAIPDGTETSSVAMKLEEMENNDALHAPETRAVPDFSTEPSQTPMKAESFDPSQALIESSTNPILHSSAPEQDALPGDPDKLWEPEVAKSLRNKILNEVSEDSLFLNFDEVLTQTSKENSSVLMPEDMNIGVGLDLSLSQIFPELQLYGMMDAMTLDNLFNSPNDGKKKGDKRADRDDPTKRVEETTYTKVCPTNRFMHQKPTLISALEPAKKWKKGRWVDLDESPVVSDVDGPPASINPDSSCTLFEGRKAAPPFQPPIILQSARNTRSSRTQEIPWSATEDSLLKTLAERYPSNWRLVADTLNSSRIRTSVDLRTPIECFDRYRSKFSPFSRNYLHHGAVAGPSHSAIAPEDSTSVNTPSNVDTPPPQTPVTPTASQMMTRGVKKMANSTAQNAINISVNTNAHTVESRKRRRHFIINESMRKTSIKREKMLRNDKEQLKKQSTVPVPAHDTHLQIGSKVRLSPMDLVQQKAEIDRRRDMERQNLLRRGIQAPQTIPQIRQQMMQQPAQARVLAQQVQAQVQAQVQVQQGASQQQQPNHAQLQNQVQNQIGMNGQIGQITAQFAPHPNVAAASNTQHSSPPNVNATAAANFPRPASSQQRPNNIPISGAQVLPLGGGTVPIARTNTSALSAYFNTNGAQLTPEQQINVVRMIQQQQEALQMQNGQQNRISQLHQAMAGYPTQPPNQP